MESKGTGGLDCSFKVLDLPSDDLESLGKWVIDLCAAHSGKSAYEILVEIESFRDQLSFVEAEHFNFLLQVALVNLGKELCFEVYVVPRQFVGNDTGGGLEGTNHFIRYDLMILVKVIKRWSNNDVRLKAVSGFDQNIQDFLSDFRKFAYPVIENQGIFIAYFEEVQDLFEFLFQGVLRKAVRKGVFGS